ncbi:SDR family NAD(P)-dependent oxidoreductase [Dactylosporangium sp. CA-092794]|uniref:SDR family NAD(P)-dependent oxidoreductase n=1 Tax=Dactylosporangium sp. CA-092794 TaxID=3239929 RepID=UPI003D8F1F9E
MRIVPGTVAVVTGAASGIGRALARELLARQARLVLADVDAQRLDHEVDALRAEGAAVVGAVTDVASPAAVRALAELAWRTYGGVEVLCNNAGVLDAALTWERTPEQWQRVIGVNLGGVVNGIHAFVPRMLADGRPAHVVSVASIAALLPRPGIAAYNASKSAVVAVSETLAMDLAAVRAAVGVSVVLPGGVATRLSRDIRTDLGDDEAPLSAGMRPPADVARQVLAGIEAGKFYIFTHPERYAGVDQRISAVLAALRGEPQEAVALAAQTDETQSSIGGHLHTTQFSGVRP